MAGDKDRSKQGRGGGRKNAPEISDADRDLWRKVTRDATPLEESRRKQKAHVQDPDAGAPAEKPAPKKPAAKTAAPRPKPTPSPPARPPRKAAPPLEAGRAAGLDRRNLERLRRGQLPIEATLDLHGDTQAVARSRLDGFLASAQAAGRRCILVITGKGTPGRDTGVIRANLPRWLNEVPNRDRVLAFAQAQPNHGGAGAFYVLIKRKRTDAGTKKGKA